MLNLLLVSLIWAFSFGLIKTGLGNIDSNYVAAVRLSVSLLVFLPFFRMREVDRSTSLRLILAGAVQYGGMYIAYLYSFHLLKAYEVALFTVFTPLYVILLSNWIQRQLNWISVAATLLAVVGTCIVEWNGEIRTNILVGFLIVQMSNLCFAFGQIYYKHILSGQVIKDEQVFALPYLGGTLAAGLSVALFTDRSHMAVSGTQWISLLYLGAVASGLCFFLWNAGARKVDEGSLAIFNDLKIPLAVIVSLAFFGEEANLLHLAIGGGMGVAALLLNEQGYRRKKNPNQGVQRATPITGN
jgi:drug/metabolite transporter (DMT)-like permease